MQDFDAKSGKMRGESRAIAEGIAYDSSLYWGAFAVSQNGILVSNTSAAASESQLTWVNRSGAVLGTVGPPGLIFNPAISPDGTRVVEDVDDVAAANVDLWIRDLTRGTATRFTFNPDEEADPVWSPDGKEIVFRRTSSLSLKSSNGVERDRVWIARTFASEDRLPNSWSPDGKQLVFTSYDPNGGNERLMLVKKDESAATPIFSGKANWANGQISADGKWLAYMSDESGSWEVYVTNFPGLAGKWQISQGGGTEPRWRHDGKELFYVSAKGVLTAVPVSTENGFSTGVAEPLFSLRARMALSSTDVFSYDVTRDGQKFIVNRYISPDRVSPLEIAIGINAPAREK
jgi:eukaryotic-like serine/threonine-protein kinase